MLDPPLSGSPGKLVGVGVGIKLNHIAWIDFKTVFYDLVQQLTAGRVFFQVLVIGSLEYDDHAWTANSQSGRGQGTAQPQLKHKCSVKLCKAVHDVDVKMTLRRACIDRSTALALPALRLQLGITRDRLGDIHPVCYSPKSAIYLILLCFPFVAAEVLFQLLGALRPVSFKVALEADVHRQRVVLTEMGLSVRRQIPKRGVTTQ